MRCLRKWQPQFDHWGLWLCALVFALGAGPAHAGVDVDELRLERTDGAVLLHVNLKLDLAPAVEEALLRGVALHFAVDAQLLRDRWYWADKKISHVARYYRLAYQPLTRVWRVQASSEPLHGASRGSRIAQSFDSLKAALDVIRRQTNWHLADETQVPVDAQHHHVVYRFRLDMGQLPRPFQLGVSQQPDWSLQLQRQLRLPSEATP